MGGERIKDGIFLLETETAVHITIRRERSSLVVEHSKSVNELLLRFRDYSSGKEYTRQLRGE